MTIRSDPISRSHYDQKRAEGKRHNQAIIALAHQHLTIMFSKLPDGCLYNPPMPKAA